MKSPPLISAVVLTYNSHDWIEKCLESLGCQTICQETEIVVADNSSFDRTVDLARSLQTKLPNLQVRDLGGNFGYCGGNNRAAEFAAGTYLLFLNPDTWLEPDCLEKLISEVRLQNVQAAQPAIFSYSGEAPDSYGVDGLDFMGTFSQTLPCQKTKEIMVVSGSCFLIEKSVFQKLGGFDEEFFMYADEDDLSFRLWLAGYRAVVVPQAILHHRGTSHVNPAGKEKIVEYRTTARARYLATRNGLLTLWKNSEHILLLLSASYIFFHLLESVAALILTRNLKFAKHAYWDAIRDAWKMRRHVFEQRRKIKRLRRRSDWWMLRFFRLRPNRWQLFVKMLKIGVPKTS
jgi:N-acetylglucosaminyl-diphospho-decaprenol L-rhamnosyltransferase